MGLNHRPSKKWNALWNVKGLIIRFWWTILFILGCYICYEQGLKKSAQDLAKLQSQFLELKKEKTLATNQRENLLRQINSQSDPQWVELALIKGLGLVPEGQIKVLFTDQKDLLEK